MTKTCCSFFFLLAISCKTIGSQKIKNLHGYLHGLHGYTVTRLFNSEASKTHLKETFLNGCRDLKLCLLVGVSHVE